MALTKEIVIKRVERIRELSLYDDEGAHSREDDLHQEVLAAIRDGECDDPAACAGEALKTLAIEFHRWCA